MTRALRFIRIGMVHPRQPEPSRIELTLSPEDRKSDRLDSFTLTERQALDLAEQIIISLVILRDKR